MATDFQTITISEFNEVNKRPSWQQELANVITDPRQLLTLLSLDPDKYLLDHKAKQLFPVRVPRPFVSRMVKGDINDPLLKQVMAVRSEFDQVEGYVTDPLEEHDTVAEGLLHKYRHRVLLIVKAGCAINCRYCFRRHFPYQDNSPNKQRWQEALDYIACHSEINEVIFSGGDPLMANDQHLSWLVGQVESIKHVKRLRIHTRLPVVIPQRITDGLANLLARTRLKVVVVLHINHPQEIDSEVVASVRSLRDKGILVLNQAVLLKGINDQASTQIDLCEKLFEADILPYYLHLLDPVAGAAHFDIDTTRAKEIAVQMMATLPGFLMPTLVREIAGEANKSPLNLA